MPRLLTPRLGSRAGWLSTTPVREADSQASDLDEDAQSSDIPGGRALAQGIVTAVLCAYVANQVIDVLTVPLPSRGLELAVEIGAVGILFVLAMWVTSAGAESWSQRRRLLTLLAEGLVTYLPMILLGKVWGDMAGFFAGSALLLLSGWVAWTLFLGTVGSMIPVAVAFGFNVYGTAYLTLSTLVLGLVVFGLARLWLAIRYIEANRGELAQLAVMNERMRFSRDLHDLLGYSLSAITLKAELTRRLVGSNTPRAREELAEILDIARQALADVRLVASSYRNISLAKEASSVTSLLSAARIETRTEITCGTLDEEIDTALATVLREAVTNMLRHSTARNCVIKAVITEDQVRLLISNDGVPRSARTSRTGGGLENLATRMTAVGGRLTTRIRADSWFDVIAHAPLTQPVPDTGQ